MKSNDKSVTGRKKIWTYLILTIMTGLMAIAAIAYYRLSDTGPFIDSLPRVTSYGIGISENMDTGFDSYVLNAPLFLQTSSTTYDAIGIDQIMQSQGRYDGPNQTYTAYSFFIKNLGGETVAVDYIMRLKEVTYGMDSYIRMLVIADGVTDRIYQKEDQMDENGSIPQDDQLPSVTYFESETTMFQGMIVKLEPQEVKSFKVIIWADQQDPDITIQDSRGLIKAQISFNISGTEEDHPTSMNQDRKLWFRLSTVCTVDFDIRYEDDEDF